MKKKENIKDLTLKVLISIRDEIVKLREDTDTRFEELRDGIAAMGKDIHEMKQDIAFMKQDMSAMKQDISVLQQDTAVMKQDMTSMKQDMKAVAAHFDRDYLLLANDVGNLKGRVDACEKALKLAS